MALAERTRRTFSSLARHRSAKQASMFTSAVTSAATSMSRVTNGVTNMFSRNDQYQEHSDLFNDGESWSIPDDRKNSSGERALDPWSREEVAQVKAMLDSEIRKEKPAEVSDGWSRQPSERSAEKKRNRRPRDEAGGAFDFPQDWLTPTASPALRPAEPADIWASVGTSTSPQPGPAWPAAAPAKDLKLPTPKDRSAPGRSRAGTDSSAIRNRQTAPVAPAVQFDEAILAALAALPSPSLVDVLQRLSERRPEEVALAFGNVVPASQKGSDILAEKEQQPDFKSENASPVSTATGRSPMLSPPTSRSDGSNVREPALPRSTNCSPSVPSAAAMAEPGMPQSGRSTPAAPNANVIAEVSVSVAEVVAAAADAAGPPQPAQGWPPAQAMNSWPSLAETQQDPWPSQVSTSPWPAAEAPGRAFDAPNM